MHKFPPKHEALNQVKGFLSDRLANRLRPKKVEPPKAAEMVEIESTEKPADDGFSAEEKDLLKKARS